MTWASSLWRQLGVALATLVLGVLTLGPGLDGLLCPDEVGLAASAGEMTAADCSATGAAPDQNDSEGFGVCLHGHCHHASPMVGALPVVAEKSAGPGAVSHDAAPAQAPPSEPTFGLKRPPRA